MSLTQADPRAIHRFRKNTNKNGPQMLGVTTTPIRCKCIRCEKMRTESTGKHTKAGFVCNCCGRSR